MIPFTKKDKCLLITGAVGLVLTIISLVMAFYGFPKIIESELRKNIVLEKGNEAWDRFVEMPFPLKFKVYIFQLVNGDEMLKGDKPKVEQIGPFVYEQFRKKENIKVDGELVSFHQFQNYKFNRAATHKDLYEEMDVTTINPLQLGMFQILEDTLVEPPFKLEVVLEEMFQGKGLIQTVKVKDVLFDGIKFCDPKGLSFSTRIVCVMITLLNIKMIDYKEDLSMTYSVFGFKNGNHDGYYTMNTGTKDMQKVGQIVKWEGKEYTNFWNQDNGKACDKIGGLDSTIYPPYIKEGAKFKVYSTDMCRSAFMSYAGHSTYKDTDTFKFKMDEDTFNFKKGQSPENSCYCIKQTKGLDGKESCYLDGLMDIHSCLGIPGVMSLPHFLHADPKYVDKIVGIKPDPEQHESDADIEPYTGFPTRGYKKAQINLIVRPSTIFGKDVPEIKDVQRSVLPVVWIEEGVEITDEYYDILTTSLTLINAVVIVQWVFVGVSVLLFVAPNIGFLVSRHLAKKNKPGV